jgi:hypothetical protein
MAANFMVLVFDSEGLGKGKGEDQIELWQSCLMSNGTGLAGRARVAWVMQRQHVLVLHASLSCHLPSATSSVQRTADKRDVSGGDARDNGVMTQSQSYFLGVT